MSSTVLVSGKFVVLHAGHIRLFRFAKEIGQVVIAGLDINGLNQSEINWRKDALSSLEFVDRVETFEGSVVNLVLRLKPEIVLKGREFEGQDNIELNIVNSYGGKLVFSSGTSYYLGYGFDEYSANRFEQDLHNSGKDYTLRNKIDKENIIEIVHKIKNLRICIIGDFIVDEIINCHPVGMSQEDPTIVATPIESRKFIGGAGIVSGHCKALGAKTTFVTVLGNDELSDWSESQFSNTLPKLVSFNEPFRKTTLKQRFKSGKQVLFKLNHFIQNPIQKSTEDAIIDFFKSEIINFDSIIFSDFSYGVVTNRISQEIISMARSLNIPVMADSQTSSQVGNLSKFIGANMVTPTELEARNEIRDDSSGLAIVAQKIRELLDTKNVLLKLGANGVLVGGVDEQGEIIRTDLVPALNMNPVDVSGAGDSMLAGTALTLAAGYSIYIAAYMGSIMSAIQVSRNGNIPISKDEILSLFR
jgi:rfaE bifunctional protein kinase chain/domain